MARDTAFFDYRFMHVSIRVSMAEPLRQAAPFAAMLVQIENGMECLQIGEVDVARGFGSSGAMRLYGIDVSSMGRFRGEIRG